MYFRLRLFLISTLFISALFAAISTPATAFDTNAKAAIVLDYNTGSVLLEKNADQPLPPASMSKLMTIYMVFEALEAGQIKLDTKFPISTKSWKMGGSKMFLNVNDRVSVADLLRGAIVQSGNDACIALAEGIAGSEAAFVKMMNRRAGELGLSNSVFANATGWPHAQHRMSMRDLALLAQLIIRDYPQYYPIFAETKFTWENIAQDNRNPLLKLGIGADGLKTGHTNEAGYGLVGSIKQTDRRVIFVITGLTSETERRNESERLANWALNAFSETKLFDAGSDIAFAKTWIGAEPEVGLTTKHDLTVLTPIDADALPKLTLEYEGPVEAPIAKGQQIAQLVVHQDALGETRVPLFANKDVARAGFVGKVKASFHLLGNKLISTSRSLLD